MPALQEAIVAEAEMMQLHADPDAPLEAVVIEARHVAGLGACATVIVRQGTLRTGMLVATDNAFCRVRTLMNASGGRIMAAGPSCPAEVTGWRNATLPSVGGEVFQLRSEADWKQSESGVVTAHANVAHREDLDRQLLKLRRERARDLSLKPIHIHSYDQLTANTLTLTVLVHADVAGSEAAICKALSELPQDKVRVSVIARTGPPTATSISHLSCSLNPCMVAFNVPVDRAIEQSLRNVRIIRHNVIYHLLDEVRDAMASLLPPVPVDSVLGRATILQLFSVGRDVVAGCRVDDGILVRGVVVVERAGAVIWSGPVRSLRHVKMEVPQAHKGMECGVLIDDGSLLRVGDSIKSIKTVMTRATID